MPATEPAVSRPAMKGFTLIELIISCAIIGLLAALAIPIFSDYTVRSQIATAVQTAVPIRSAVDDLLLAGVPPVAIDNDAVGFTGEPLPLGTLTVGPFSALGRGRVEFVFGNGASARLQSSGARIGFERGSDGIWRCTSSGIQAAFLPATC